MIARTPLELMRSYRRWQLRELARAWAQAHAARKAQVGT